MWNQHSFSPESSRTWVILFCLGVGGFMSVMIAAALGPMATHSLVLVTACAIFLVSGSLLGLLVSHQVCHTHLKDDPAPAVEPVPAAVVPASPAKTGIRPLLAGNTATVQPRVRGRSQG